MSDSHSQRPPINSDSFDENKAHEDQGIHVEHGDQTFESPTLAEIAKNIEINTQPSAPVDHPTTSSKEFEVKTQPAFPVDIPSLSSKEFEIKTQPALPLDHPTTSSSCGNACSSDKACFSGSFCNPHVRDLLLWKCPVGTGIVFAGLLLIQFSLVCHSVISVVAYQGLAILAASLAFKLYTQFVSNSVVKCDALKCVNNCDWKVSEDALVKFAQKLTNCINSSTACARDLFLFKNYAKTAKFAAFLYFLTYLGACFNLLTLLIIDTIALFTLPKIYVTYKHEIDHVVKLLLAHIKEHKKTVRAKLVDVPFIGQMLKKRD
jgi:hypothetical protein